MRAAIVFVAALAGACAKGKTTEAPSDASSLSEAQIESVTRGHARDVRRACFDGVDASVADVSVVVHVRIDGAGRVRSAVSEGNDAAIGACVEHAIASWTFPGGPAQIDLPFSFFRR